MKPFLKPLIKSPSSASTRILIRNQSYLSNNSEYSKNNNSSTTVASAIWKRPKFLPKLRTPKASQILKTPKLNFFKRNNDLSIFESATPSIRSSKSIKEMFELIDQADKIVRNRMNMHGVNIGTSKHHLRKVSIAISKAISQKNYTINLLREQRTKINEKEYIINQAVNEFSAQYENDYKNFIDFVAEEKRKQIAEEAAMNNLREQKERKRSNLEEEILMSKRLEETLDKKVREVFLLKSYGSFLHQVFNKKFSFDEITEQETRARNIDKVIIKLIDLYETKNKYEDYPKELNDTEKLMKTYIDFEDKILLALNDKDMVIKENILQQKIHEKDLDMLKFSLRDYQNDFRNIKEEKNRVVTEMKDYKVSQNEMLKTILTCIADLGKELNIKYPIPTSIDNDHLTDFSIYAKKTLEHLRNIEMLSNKLINEIETALEYGTLDDKLLMDKCIGDQKKINKKEKQLKFKMIQEELEHQKNLKAIERAKKLIIKGRKAPMIFNMKHKKLEKINKFEKNKEKINIYDIKDEEDDSEESKN